MASTNGAINLATELKALKHDMKNQKMKKLPANTTIQRRPLHHAPVASPFAGASVQKVVYVSTHTPLMAAVKRVRKLLSEIEKRALQEPYGGRPSAQSIANLEAMSDRLKKTNEEVLVKASGRAMAQALKVGNWFRTRENEMACKVEVRTGSVQAVDDIVETEGTTENLESNEPEEASNNTTTLEGGETTMELLGETVNSPVKDSMETSYPEKQDPDQGTIGNKNAHKKKRKRSRRKRAAYDQDDVPEARLRWVKTVEVAISFKA